MGILDKWVNSATTSLQDKFKTKNSDYTAGSTTTDPQLLNSSRDYLVIIKQDQDSDPSMSKKPIIVVGQVPEEVQINQTVKWSTPWGAGLAGDNTVSDLLAVTGNRLVAQSLTLKVWQGSGDDFEMTLGFELRAWSDPDRDVMIPLQQLMSMTLPSIDSNGFMQSPGPILTEQGLNAIGQGITQVVGKSIGIAKNTAGKLLDSTKDGAAAVMGVAVSGAKELTQTASVVARKSFIESYLKNKISINIGSWFEMSNVVITNVQHTLKGQQPGPNGAIMAANVQVTFAPMFALTAEDIPNLLKLSTQSSSSFNTNALTNPSR